MLKEKLLRSSVHSQQIESMEQFYEWEEHVIVVGITQTSYKGNSWGNHTEFQKYNSIKNLYMLWKYLHYLANETEESSFNDDPYTFMGPEEFKLITRKQFMQWRLEHSSQQAKLPKGNGNRDIPSQTPRSNPIRLLINSLSSRRVLKE